MSYLGAKKCCAPKCDTSTYDVHLSLFRFPKDEPRCSLWRRLLRNRVYDALTPTECYNRLRLCSLHFENYCFANAQKTRLKRDALPTFHFEGDYDQDLEQRISPEQSESPECHNINESDLPLAKKIKLGDDLPGLSFSANEEVSIVLQGKNIQTRSHEECLYPSVSSSESFPSQYVCLEQATEKEMDTVEAEKKTTKQKTLTSSKGTGHRRYILRNLNITKQIQLTPKAKRTYKMVREWSAKANLAARKLKSYESRLAEAERVASSSNFKQFKNLINNINYKFIMRKIKNQKLLPRFSIEEKILATTLMKSSGNGYRLLSQIFILPSRQTITNLLLNIILQPGINSHVFQELKEAVSKTNDRDKYVS